MWDNWLEMMLAILSYLSRENIVIILSFEWAFSPTTSRYLILFFFHCWLLDFNAQNPSASHGTGNRVPEDLSTHSDI